MDDTIIVNACFGTSVVTTNYDEIVAHATDRFAQRAARESIRRNRHLDHVFSALDREILAADTIIHIAGHGESSVVNEALLRSRLLLVVPCARPAPLSIGSAARRAARRALAVRLRRNPVGPIRRADARRAVRLYLAGRMPQIDLVRAYIRHHGFDFHTSGPRAGTAMLTGAVTPAAPPLAA